ncbi:MAG: hypothetical protein ACTSVY_09350 [Candidatus Helarchaeota archaeon]
MNIIIRAILGVVSVVLIIFGALFLMASSVENMVPRIITGCILVAIAFVLIIFAYKGKDKQEITIIQKVDLPVGSTVEKLTCKNCGGILDRDTIQMKNGVLTIKCPYCGTANEFSEAPKW